MKKKIGMVCGVLLVLGAFALTSCDEFFSASWGKDAVREYDPNKIALDARNVDKWLSKATGNPKLAKALAEKIGKEVQRGGLSAPDKFKLQEVGITLAITGSGIGTSMLANAGDLISKISSNEGTEVGNITGILGQVQNDFKSNDGASAGKELATIAATALGTNGNFTGLYAEKAKPGDVAQAVLVLTLAMAEKNGKPMSEINLESLGDDSPLGIKVDNSGTPTVSDQSSQEAKVLVAYLNLIKNGGDAYDKNPITGAIKSAFKLNA